MIPLSDFRETPIPPHERRLCSQCGAYCHNDAVACWFCQRKLAAKTESRLQRGQFSLLSLLSVTTAVSVLLGMFLAAPPLAVVTMVFSGAALARMKLQDLLPSASGGSRPVLPFALRFVASVMFIFMSMAAGLAVFILGCAVAAALSTPSRPIDDFPFWPIGLGFFLGLAAAGWVFCATLGKVKYD